MGKKAIRDIEHGMVFDHVKPGYGTKISNVLKSRIWPEEMHPVYTGEGIEGGRGAKDFVKLDGLHLPVGCDALNDIAVVQPDITVNWIENSERTEKKQARQCIGDVIKTNLVDCENTNCIANDEAPGIYEVLDRDSLMVRCHYCGKVFEAKYNGR